MPLSDHEQRMLDQIESALYAEDPKFASSVRGGNLRAPSARRRLQGAVLFVIGLATAGVAVCRSTANDRTVFLILSRCRVRRDVRRRGVRDHRPARGGGRRPLRRPSQDAPRQKRGKGSGGSFTSRMEDRFRRRFDE